MHAYIRVLWVALLIPASLSVAQTKPVADVQGVWRAKAPYGWKIQADGGTTMVSSPDGRTYVGFNVEERRSVTLDQWAEAINAELQTRWENYVSKHLTFTIRKPAGWVVDDGFQLEPTLWAFSVTLSAFTPPTAT